MQDIKLQLSQRKGVTLADFAQNHSDAIAAEPVVFATPDPAPAPFNALVANFLDASAAQTTAKQLAKQKTQERDAARLALENGLRVRGMYVSKLAAGRVAIINAAGFDARNIPAPAPVPATPTLLEAAMGNYNGSVQLKWKPVPMVMSYNLQMCADPLNEQNFTHLATVTRSSFLVRDLIAGHKYWFRVAAVGAAGQSEWTDAILKMVAY